MAEGGGEALLALGRLEEKKGRMRAAESAFARALRAEPASASLQREYARFLESRGRPKEAEARLLRAVALGWPREEGESSLARLRAKRSPAALAEEGRFAEAAAALAGAPAGPENDALLAKVFSALLCGGAYEAAFRLAEAGLRRSPQAALAQKALWPWWHAVSSRGSAAKDRFCEEELARVRAAGAGRRRRAWYAYLRGVLLLALERKAEAAAEAEALRGLAAPLSPVLRYPFVLARLGGPEAVPGLEELLAAAPSYWWLRCRLGEALMAAGRRAEGLAEFARAEAAAEGADRAAIAAWHGGALLWAGSGRRALAKLDEAIALGAVLWARCWRGGALVLLGRPARALADLDAAIASDARDLEAHLWRGEALRRLGRRAEARRSLDRALALDPKYGWAYVNRALLRGDSGDHEGMAADAARVPAELLGGKGPRTRRALEACLARAGGVRRPERHLNLVWLRARG